MTRVAKFVPADLDAEQLALYESIVGGPRAQGPQAFQLTDDRGGLEGPFNAMLLSPGLGAALQSLGAAARYGSTLTPRSREIVILLVAHHWRSEFEIYAHEAVAATVGLSGTELTSLRDGRLAELVDPLERTIAETTQALVTGGDLDDASYERATEQLGRALVFELTTIVGYYALLALQLRVFRVACP